MQHSVHDNARVVVDPVPPFVPVSLEILQVGWTGRFAIFLEYFQGDHVWHRRGLAPAVTVSWPTANVYVYVYVIRWI